MMSYKAALVLWIYLHDNLVYTCFILQSSSVKSLITTNVENKYTNKTLLLKNNINCFIFKFYNNHNISTNKFKLKTVWIKFFKRSKIYVFKKPLKILLSKKDPFLSKNGCFNLVQ